MLFTVESFSTSTVSADSSVEAAETVASTENATVVDDAINNGTQQADQITAGMVNPSKTVKQKYQSAFNDEGFVITK